MSIKILIFTHKTLKQNVLPNDGAHVSGEVASARRGAEVFLRVQPVRVDHEVPIRQVSSVMETPCF